jgi:integrase/recombinase XerD
VSEDVGKSTLVPAHDSDADAIEGVIEPSSTVLARTAGVFPDSERAIHEYIEGQLSPRSKQNALDALRRLARLLSQGTISDPTLFPWAAIDYGLAKRIRSALYAQTLEGAITPGTANLTLSHLRGLIRTMYEMDLVDSRQHELTHTKALKNVSGSRKPRGRALAPREEKALREAARRLDGYQGAMLDTAIVLAMGGGFRREEIADLTVENVGPQTISIIGKGNRERGVPIDPQMRDISDAWLDERTRIAPTHGNLFCSPQRPEIELSPWGFWALVRKATHDAFGTSKPCNETCKCLEIVTGPHDFRRTFATRCLEQGLDIRQVQVLMGHASPETTARYDKRDVETIFEKRRNIRIIS